MEALSSGYNFLFDGFGLDRWGLFRRDERGVFVPAAIGARALDVLRVLIAADGALVSKDEIMAVVWPGIVVEDNNLTVQMSALRHVLDLGRAEGSCIQTVTGRGYRFVASVTRVEPLFCQYPREFPASEAAGSRPNMGVRPHWPHCCRLPIGLQSLCCRSPI
jgi:DNA-binding winged helix-turn-helix (wHTH) protein